VEVRTVEAEASDMRPHKVMTSDEASGSGEHRFKGARETPRDSAFATNVKIF
jgi:hypothetical protein